jgi:hypothetical protein
MYFKQEHKIEEIWVYHTCRSLSEAKKIRILTERTDVSNCQQNYLMQCNLPKYKHNVFSLISQSNIFSNFLGYCILRYFTEVVTLHFYTYTVESEVTGK